MKPFRWGDPKPAVLVRHWERVVRLEQDKRQRVANWNAALRQFADDEENKRIAREMLELERR